MEELPRAGSWYETTEGEAFVVTAVDQASGVVDVQYLDGEVDQYDRRAWREAELQEIEPPEEWRGSMDDFFRERGRGK